MEPRIYSQDKFFAEAVRNVIKEMGADFPLGVYNSPVFICSGMTLFEAMELYGGRGDSEKCIVICSYACERMLSATVGFHAALFINSKASVSELKAAFFRFGRMQLSGNKTELRYFGLTCLNCCIVNAFLKGETVDSIARRCNISSKGVYRHIELSMSKLKVETKQEFYYKWLLIFSNEDQNNKRVSAAISLAEIQQSDSHTFFSIVSA